MYPFHKGNQHPWLLKNKILRKSNLSLNMYEYYENWDLNIKKKREDSFFTDCTSDIKKILCQVYVYQVIYPNFGRKS